MKYKVTVTTLTPLHIGTGTEFLRDFDFRSVGDTTFVLNQDAIYARELEQNGANAQLNKPAGALVTTTDLKIDSLLVRYTLNGSTTVAQVREQIKDVYGRCYLPGSSLKGALRTALLRYAVEARLFQPNPANRGRNPKFADDEWEKEVFGSNANRDVLRALQVADSTSLPLMPTPLELGMVRVLVNAQDAGKTESEIPVAVEAVRAGVTFETILTLDELTLQYSEDPRLDWQKRSQWLAHLPEIAQQAGRRHLNEELAIAQKKSLTAVEAFYKEQLTGDQTTIVLQMSWGTGWNGMTVGEHLPQAAHDQARQIYSLGMPPNLNRTQREQWQPNLSRPFPKTRRLVNGDAVQGLPLGWVRLILEPLEQPKPLLAKLIQTPLPPMKVEATPRVYTRISPATHSPLVPKPTAPPPPRLPPTPRSPLVETFTGVPKVGDRFKGKVSEQDGRAIVLDIPGLDSEVAYAYIAPEDNDTARRYEKDEIVVCEVIALKHLGKMCEVQCRRG